MPGTNSLLGGGGFHHVAMKVADFERSVRMYAQGLGFAHKAAWGEGDSRGVMLDTGDGNYMEIFAGGPKIPHAIQNPMHAAGPFLHVAIRTNDVPKSVAKAVAAGFVVTVPTKTITIPAEKPIEVTLAFIQGPDGEVLEFFDNVVT